MDACVSIVIPVSCNDDRNDVRDAIAGALGQGYPNIEILVICGSGMDALDMFPGKIQPLYTKLTNKSGMLNFGINRAKGDFIAWLSPGDKYLPDKIAEQMRIIKTRGNPRLILAGGWQVLNERGDPLYDVDPIGGAQYTQEDLNRPIFALIHHALRGSSFLIHKSLFSEAGFFDDSWDAMFELEFFFRTMRKQKMYYHPGIYVQAGPERISAQKNFNDVKGKEEEKIWLHIFSSLTDEEIVGLYGSKYKFFNHFTENDFFKQAHMKQTKALLDANFLKEVNKLTDGNQDLAFYRQFSLFIYELSNGYESRFREQYQSLSYGTKTPSLFWKLKLEIKKLILQILRFAFHSFRKAIEYFGIKEQVKQNWLYKKLFARGIIEKLQ
jgi:hypothetical protein